VQIKCEQVAGLVDKFLHASRLKLRQLAINLHGR